MLLEQLSYTSVVHIFGLVVLKQPIDEDVHSFFVLAIRPGGVQVSDEAVSLRVVLGGQVRRVQGGVVREVLFAVAYVLLHLVDIDQRRRRRGHKVS